MSSKPEPKGRRVVSQLETSNVQGRRGRTQIGDKSQELAVGAGR